MDIDIGRPRPHALVCACGLFIYKIPFSKDYLVLFRILEIFMNYIFNFPDSVRKTVSLLGIAALLATSLPFGALTAFAARTGVGVSAHAGVTAEVNVPIRLQAQLTDDMVNETNEQTELILTDDNKGGVFTNANASECTTDLGTSLQTRTVSDKNKNENFCYKNALAGTYTISVQAQVGGVDRGLPATMVVTVTEPVISHVVTATNFNTHVGDDYEGINVGFTLEKEFGTVSAVKVQLYKGGDLIVENNHNQALLDLINNGETSLSTPFIIKNGTYTETYWNLGSHTWTSDDVPTKVAIIVTYSNGNTSADYLVENSNLVEPNGWDVADILPLLPYVFPSTNDTNRTDKRPHVNLLTTGTEDITLEFVNTTNSLARFEIRIDGVSVGSTAHPVVTGDVIHPGPCVDGRTVPKPAECALGAGPRILTYSADSTVEVRLALGGERDWDFDWVRFDVLSVPDPVLSPTKPSLSGDVIYDAISPILPPSYPSLSFQATQTYEVGDLLTFAGTNRNLLSGAITLTSWACESNTWNSGLCETTPGATFSHPITLNIYEVADDGTAGNLITSKTQTFNIPFRPSANPICTDTNQWKDTEGNCYSGYNHVVVFDLTGITVPDSIVYGVKFNTQSYGDSPIGVDGPYNSLNVGLNTDVALAPYIGNDVIDNQLFWDSTYSGRLRGFNIDNDWPYRVAVAFTAEPEQTNPSTGGGTSGGGRRDSDTNTGPIPQVLGASTDEELYQLLEAIKQRLIELSVIAAQNQAGNVLGIADTANAQATDNSASTSTLEGVIEEEEIIVEDEDLVINQEESDDEEEDTFSWFNLIWWFILLAVLIAGYVIWRKRSIS